MRSTIRTVKSPVMKSLIVMSVMLISSPVLFGQSENEITRVAEQRKLMNYEISLSPNPSNGNFELRARQGSVVQISSTSGTYVGTWMMEEETLFFEGLPVGTYVIIITSDDSVETRKLLVL